MSYAPRNSSDDLLEDEPGEYPAEKELNFNEDEFDTAFDEDVNELDEDLELDETAA